MEDDELERLRQKRLQELQVQSQYEEQQQRAEEQRAQEKAVRQNMLRQILTPTARERLGRLRMARPDLVKQVEQQLIALAQNGRIRQQVDDRTLKQLLARIMPKKKDIKIERR